MSFVEILGDGPALGSIHYQCPGPSDVKTSRVEPTVADRRLRRLRGLLELRLSIRRTPKCLPSSAIAEMQDDKSWCRGEGL